MGAAEPADLQAAATIAALQSQIAAMQIAGPSAASRLRGAASQGLPRGGPPIVGLPTGKKVASHCGAAHWKEVGLPL